MYVVSTPIGNLADLSPRAADTLRSVRRILAEASPPLPEMVKPTTALPLAGLRFFAVLRILRITSAP